MYETEPEFPEGQGGVRKNPFRGEGMEIFWNYTSPQDLGNRLQIHETDWWKLKLFTPSRLNAKPLQ